MGHELLRTFPVVVEIPIAWADMDAYGHVNNTVYLRWFESARIAYFERTGLYEVKEETGIGPILASTRCRFRLPLTYPDTVMAGARTSEIGDDRFVMDYAVVSRARDQLAADGDGLVVTYDYKVRAKARLPDAVRKRIAELEAASSPA